METVGSSEASDLASGLCVPLLLDTLCVTFGPLFFYVATF